MRLWLLGLLLATVSAQRRAPAAAAASVATATTAAPAQTASAARSALGRQFCHYGTVWSDVSGGCVSACGGDDDGHDGYSSLYDEQAHHWHDYDYGEGLDNDVFETYEHGDHIKIHHQHEHEHDAPHEDPDPHRWDEHGHDNSHHDNPHDSVRLAKESP